MRLCKRDARVDTDLALSFRSVHGLGGIQTCHICNGIQNKIMCVTIINPTERYVKFFTDNVI